MLVIHSYMRPNGNERILVVVAVVIEVVGVAAVAIMEPIGVSTNTGRVEASAIAAASTMTDSG